MKSANPASSSSSMRPRYYRKIGIKVYRVMTDNGVSFRSLCYARAYASSAERTNHLAPFLNHYNQHRKHFGIKGKTPFSRLDVNNLSRHDS